MGLKHSWVLLATLSPPTLSLQGKAVLWPKELESHHYPVVLPPIGPTSISGHRHLSPSCPLMSLPLLILFLRPPPLCCFLILTLALGLKGLALVLTAQGMPRIHSIREYPVHSASLTCPFFALFSHHRRQNHSVVLSCSQPPAPWELGRGMPSVLAFHSNKRYAAVSLQMRKLMPK